VNVALENPIVDRANRDSRKRGGHNSGDGADEAGET